MDLMDWDSVHRTDEPDQTDSQPPLAETIENSTAPNIMGPSAMRVGGQTLRTPMTMLPTTSNPSTRAAILNAEWTPSSWREAPEHERPMLWASLEEHLRTMPAHRPASDVRTYPADYGGPTGFRRAVNGYTMYRQQQEYLNRPRDRVRSPYDTVPLLRPPSANEPNARMQPPNERQGYFPVQPIVTRRSATGTNANSSGTLVDVRTEGSGSDSDRDIPQREVRDTVSPNALGQTYTALGRQIQVQTTQVDFQSAAGARHSPLPAARRDRTMGAQSMAGHNDDRRALEEVPDLDQRDRRPPPPTKSPEEMIVNLECKVCFEQTCNVVILPCRKSHSRKIGIIGFIVDGV